MSSSSLFSPSTFETRAPGEPKEMAVLSKPSVSYDAGTKEQRSEMSASRKSTSTSTLYPKIFKLSDFIFAVKSLPEYQSPSTTVPLIGSTKLHGTHADVVFESATSEKIRLQSRNQLELKAGKQDNVGFAAWVASFGEKQGVLLRLRDRFVERYRELNPCTVVEGEVIIAAEWCGTGIQKKVAISQMPRFLAIISVFINSRWVPDWEYADIEDAERRIFNIGRAGYFRHELRLDDEGLAGPETEIRRMTDEVERECPFAKQVCGESGLGEGIVWKAVNHCGNPKYWFKSKGDQFTVSNVNKLAASAVDKQNMERVRNFAKAIVTENRMEQGWDLLNQKDLGGLGLFLKWVVEDCLVEEKREMEGLEISKGKLSPAIVAIAKPWFLDKVA